MLGCFLLLSSLEDDNNRLKKKVKENIPASRIEGLDDVLRATERGLIMYKGSPVKLGPSFEDFNDLKASFEEYTDDGSLSRGAMEEWVRKLEEKVEELEKRPVFRPQVNAVAYEQFLVSIDEIKPGPGPQAEDDLKPWQTRRQDGVIENG